MELSDIWQRPKWFFKQLFPLHYSSVYGENGQRKITTWDMWLGKCYNIRTFNIS